MGAGASTLSPSEPFWSVARAVPCTGAALFPSRSRRLLRASRHQTFDKSPSTAPPPPAQYCGPCVGDRRGDMNIRAFLFSKVNFDNFISIMPTLNTTDTGRFRDAEAPHGQAGQGPLHALNVSYGVGYPSHRDAARIDGSTEGRPAARCRQARRPRRTADMGTNAQKAGGCTPRCPGRVLSASRR